MNKIIFETLEFDKVLSHLASFTTSTLGKELISQVIPFSDHSLIQQSLTEVTEARAIIDFDDPFPIYGLTDIRPLLKKTSIAGNYLPAEELTQVCTALSVFRKLNGYFKIRKEKYPLLDKISVDLLSYPQIEKEISRCINPENNEIYNNASPNLALLRKSIASTQQKIRKKMENMVASLSQKKYLQESVVTIRDGRFVLMVKDEYRQRVKGIIHDQSATGATLFIEPMETLELNNQIRAQRIEEKREVEKILRHLTTLIGEELDSINRSLSAAARFDFIYAKAQFSSVIGGHQPYLNDKNKLEIIKGIHPLLLLHKGKKDKVVPLDLIIEERFNTLIITGPNAGGKTVALKTLGLLSLMTLCGLHIPADPSSDICIFQNIFCAIGDQQSIENDLSTFSSHVEKLKNIVDNASRDSLVLVDEIGSGTDPEEGAALAIAVLEKLTAVGCITVVSTHQGVLKAFAHETDGVENGSMEFNAETLQPTYRFRLGLPGSSYAFEIAQRWGLSEDIISRSRQLVGKEKHRLENLLVDLEKKMTKYQASFNDISIKQSELDGLIKLYTEKRIQIDENEKRLKKQAIEESKEILKSANALVEQAIKEIKEEQASREAIISAKQKLERGREKIKAHKKALQEKVKQVGHKPLTEIKLGQKVMWKSFHIRGTVLSDADSADKVLIDTGVVKIKVPIGELEEATIESAKSPNVKIKYNIERSASSEIDLRGMRADEAIESTAKFIEEALLADLQHVYVIHGKGTGALRRAINDFLNNHAQVKSKHLAEWNQGGTGVTVVELK